MVRMFAALAAVLIFAGAADAGVRKSRARTVTRGTETVTVVAVPAKPAPAAVPAKPAPAATIPAAASNCSGSGCDTRVRGFQFLRFR